MFRRLLLVAALAFPAFARDRAVLVYPKEHGLFRRIFYSRHQKELQQQLASRYDVEKHDQIGSARQLFAIDVAGAKLLVLSAHGDPYSMHFTGRKERTLDARDRERLKIFLSRLAPDATIVLQSCDTGRGFAHLVKEAAGPSRKVIAARGEVPANGLQITSVAPFDATILCDGRAARWDCTLRLR